MQRQFHSILLIFSLILVASGKLSGQYCIPNPTEGAIYNTYIDSVALGTIDNQDTFSPTDTSYSDYTGAYHGQTSLARGSTYDLTIKGGPYYTSMHYVAWIDYNNDSDFSDANEKLGEFTTTSAGQVFTIAFTVPVGVDLLKTRLRIRCVWNVTNPDPCTDYEYGETEDYLIVITEFENVGTGVDGTFGDLAFFNYNTDNDYDIIIHDEFSSTDPVLFYLNSGGNYSPFFYLNTPFPETDNDNLHFNLCDLNSDNRLDAIFTYRHNSNLSRTLYYEKVTVLNNTPTNLPDLKRGSSAAADLNNDGKQDVIICGQDNDDVPHTYIYENTDAGLVMVNDNLPGVYGQVLLADYDNDMDIDIFLFGTDQYGNTNGSIYRNDNNWNFTNIYANIQKIGWIGDVTLTDLNNDGLVDIAIEEKIYKNNGDDTFSEMYVEITDFLYDGIQFTDLDNDGIVEMISQDAYGIIINKNNGLDSFLIQEQLFVKGENFVIGDYNNDYKPDIMVNYYKEIAMLKNNISFTNSPPAAPLNLVSSIGDSGYYSVNLSWDPASDDATPADGLTYNLRVGTGPGKNDIVSSMTSSTYATLLKPGMGNVFFNTSWYLKDLEPGTYYWTVQSVDNTQVASSFATEQQFEILAPFTESTFLVDGQIINSGTGADFDGDGDMDILLRDSLIAIYEQTSPYNFSYHIVDSNFIALKISDVNSDNLPDIIGKHSRQFPAETHDSLVIYINDGSYNFKSIDLDTLSISSIAAEDFDNDGDIDILVHDDSLFLFVCTDSLVYQRKTLPITEVYYNAALSAADIDNDGDLDFLIAGADEAYGGNNNSSIYKNDGNLNFSKSQSLQPGIGTSEFHVTVASYILFPADIHWNDFNFDGYLDLSITGDDSYRNSNNLIFVNDGTGHFSVTDISPRPSNRHATSWIDLNTDGFIDLLLPKNNFEIDNVFYLNDNNSSYTAFPNALDSILNLLYLGSLDMDNDFDKDIIYTYKIPSGFSYTTKTVIQVNNYNFTNYPPDPPAAIFSEIDSFTVILKWEPGYDALTNNDGLSYNIWLGTEKDKANIISPLASMTNGYRFVEYLGNAGTSLSRRIENLPLGKYYWSVQSIDNSLQGSSWADIDSFEISSLTALFSYDTVCLGAQTSFTDNSVSTNTVDSWSWIFEGGQTSSVQNPTHTFSQAGNTPVKLIVSSGGILDSITKNVYVKFVPEVDYSADAVCDGELSTFINSSITNGLSIDEWYWNFGDGTNSYQENPGTHGYINPGDYTTKLRISASNGCIDSLSTVVSVGSIPTAGITASGSPAFCTGDSIVLSNTYNASYLYQWQLGGTDLTAADSSAYTAKISGDYTVEVLNPVGSCVAISDPVNIQVNPLPSPPLITNTGLSSFCSGDSTVLSAAFSSSNNYQWKLDGSDIGSNSNTVTAKDAGEYTLLVSNSNGCTMLSSNSVSISVFQNPVIPNVDLSDVTTFCEGDSVALSVTPDASLTYQWMDGAVTISGADTNKYIARTSGSFILNISNSNECTSSTNPVNVLVNPSPPSPTISITGNEEFCAADSAILSVSDNTDLSYQWRLNGGVVGSDLNSYIARSSGTYTLDVTNSSNCKAESLNPVSITVNPKPALPNIIQVGDSSICAGETLTLTVAEPGPESYQWLLNNNPIAGKTGSSLSILSTGSYNLRVRNSDMCEVYTSAKYFTVKDQPRVPQLDVENYIDGDCKSIFPVSITITNVETGTNYQWYDGENIISNETSIELNNIDEGTFKVIASIETCYSESEVVDISYPAMPKKPTIIVEGPNIWYLACSNDNGTDYNWYFNDTEITGANDYVYIAGTKLGKYKVGVKENTDCYNYSDEIQIPLTTGIEEHPFANLKIYPNPTPGLFTLEMDNAIMGELIIDIYKENGSRIINIVFLKEINHFATQIDLSDQPAGLYLIGLVLDEWKTSRSLIVQ